MYVLRNKLANVKKTGLRTERELHLELRVTGRLSIDWMEVKATHPGSSLQERRPLKWCSEVNPVLQYVSSPAIGHSESFGVSPA